MKTCKNCGTTNAVENIKCTGCNMPGNFEFHGEVAEIQAEPETTNVVCNNCGNFHPGEGTHCVHCRFPIEANPMKSISKQSLRLIRKVG